MPFPTLPLQYFAIHIACGLIFAGFIIRGFAKKFCIFRVLSLRLLGTVVLQYLRVTYSQTYGVGLYTIIVYGSCRCAKLGLIFSGIKAHTVLDYAIQYYGIHDHR